MRYEASWGCFRKSRAEVLLNTYVKMKVLITFRLIDWYNFVFTKRTPMNSLVVFVVLLDLSNEAKRTFKLNDQLY